MIFDSMSFLETMFYAVTVLDLQMVRDQKNFGNNCTSLH